MANMRLDLEYDGTDFHGWQAQPANSGVRTVAAELAQALQRATGEAPTIVAAGRTDAGAHSLGQTVSFQLEREIAPDRLRAALNGLLPPDVAVVAAQVAPDDFHARFSARRRHYRYLVENRDARSAVLRARAWQVQHPLDIRAMRRAAAQLVGRRDMAAFGRDPGGRNTVRNLEAIRIRGFRGATTGRTVAFDLTADAFLYGMVRRIVGFLVDVGLGKRTPGEARSLAGVRVAPARGLYQMAAEY
ncbi:MAG: tRNA pseudouridine38-40 synthase [Chloroflexota bacterium]|jgi:tRNA pseudouridine38-40 synthase|nr:tRNA pseudouridine38-40 synthase [Chloroflexota bacterium]